MPSTQYTRAITVPEGFYPSRDLASYEEIRACMVCRIEFFVDKRDRSQSRRMYCCEDHKNRASNMRQYMRANGYIPDVVAYVANPELYPPINPIGKARGPSMDFEVHAPRFAPTPVLIKTVAHQQNGEKLEVERERTKRTRIQKNQEDVKLESLYAEAAATVKDRENREVIKKAMKSLEIIPVEQRFKDIQSGKQTYIPDAELAKIRGVISVVVSNHVLLADLVLTGQIVWTSAQVNLFGKLLSKVVPDAASAKLKPANGSGPSDMSITELEELVAAAKVIQKAKPINPTPQPEQSNAK